MNQHLVWGSEQSTVYALFSDGNIQHILCSKEQEYQWIKVLQDKEGVVLTGVFGE